MLQGSLDNFALDEVLGLLSSTSKTGKLDVKGNRGSGMLRLLEGRLVDATASNTANGSEPEDVLFELLRFADGTFNFSSSGVEEGSFSNEIQDVLGSAERRLADWRTIEAVVPSLRHRVVPVPALSEDEVSIARQEWMVLMMIAGGCPVSTVCDELGLGEVEGSRQIKGLAERGLVTVLDPKTGATFRRQSVDSLRLPAAGIKDPTGVELPVVTVTVNDEVSNVPTAEDDATPATLAPAAEERRTLLPPPPVAPASGDVKRPPVGLQGLDKDTTPDSDAETKVDSSSHGGLLMRYLKSDD